MAKSPFRADADVAGGANRELYYDSYFGLHAAKIGPGELYASRRNILIVTVLGSCVSACLRDPVSRIGGMNHFMLPDRAGNSSLLSEPARYGAHAMEMLINNLLSMGAQRDRLEAKVFGAGRVLPGMSDVGARNAEFALAYLERERIPVKARDVGGNHPRKVYMFIESGRVLVKDIHQLRNDTVLSRERAYAVEIGAKRITSGDIELFGE
ncbi:MAG TPA: chemoreceptor glutamine deamidase CheD [Burkholderiales bacterium]|nr:chemoreceptor glutamine deamidase CheD [Burkholderiales bacterium]